MYRHIHRSLQLEEYIQKISFLLSPDGLLIFESQALDVLVPSAFDLKLEILDTITGDYNGNVDPVITVAAPADFIDGDTHNFDINNIRLLCPNCYLSYNGEFYKSKVFCK